MSLAERELPFVCANEHELPHPDAPLEWWYLNGWYATPHGARRHFFLALFCSRSPATGDPPAFQLMLSRLDEGSRAYHTCTRIDGMMVDRAKQIVHGLAAAVDTRVHSAFCDELDCDVAPAPIVTDDAKVECSDDVLDVLWRDFLLSQDDSGFSLRFDEPGSADRCSFSLESLRPRAEVEGGVGWGRGKMAYIIYPRLQLRGTRGGDPVTGEAWLDHQWGGYSMLASADAGKQLCAWEWISANLDDGTDWMFCLHRDGRTGEIVGKYLTVYGPDGCAETMHDFEMRATRTWVSPRTYIRHPIAWHIEVSSFKASFDFEPLAADQEVPVFGLMRAIWEGAGRITGVISGRHVHGRAVAEAHGFGYVFDVKQFLDTAAERITGRLSELLPRPATPAATAAMAGKPKAKYDDAIYDATIAAPVWDLLDRNGKCWRPIFGLLMLEALGVDHPVYERLLAATELAHVGALIIDDIQDDSLLRRGDKCIHLKYGTDVAINAANATYFIPLLAVSEQKTLTGAQRAAISATISRQFMRAHLGQGMDLYYGRNMSCGNLAQWLKCRPENAIKEMYAMKTSGIVEGLAETAAIVARSPARSRRVCASYARSLGIAFQIVDDVHNFSASPRWRKTSGEDLAEGKLTYVIVRALTWLTGSSSARLAEILCSPELRACKDAISEGTDLIVRSGALEQCRDEARAMLRDSWSRVKPCLLPSHARIMLRCLGEHLVDLDFGA